MTRENWPPGVRAVYGFPPGSRKAGRGASEIQSLLFEKSTWTPSKARRWLESRGFKYGKMDPGGERADYYHFRQTEPSGFARMRMSENPHRRSDPKTIARRLIREMEVNSWASFDVRKSQLESLIEGVRRMIADGAQFNDADISELAAGEETERADAYGGYDGYTLVNSTLNDIIQGPLSED